MTTANNVPNFLATYSGINRFAYAGRNGEIVGTTVDNRSRAVWNAKEQIRNHKVGEVWSRTNAGDWQIDAQGMKDLDRLVAEGLDKDAKGGEKFYYEPKARSSGKKEKSGKQAALAHLAAIAKTLAGNEAQGFNMTPADETTLKTAIDRVLEYMTGSKK